MSLDDKQRDALLRAYAIIDNFHDFMLTEVYESMSTLYLTDNYEDLSTAKGLIGDVLDDDSLKVEHLLITQQDTRNKLSNAYQACDEIVQTTEAESECADALAKLKACIYTILNATYGEKSVKEVIDSLLEVYEIGENLTDTVEQTYTGILDISDRINQLKDLFKSLKPEASVNDIPN